MPTSQFFFYIDDEITQHDLGGDSSNPNSDPIDEKVSPAVRNVEIVDFGIEDQFRELKIDLPLSTYEKDRLIHLLRSYMDGFTWSYEDMLGLDSSITRKIFQHVIRKRNFHK